MNGLIRANKTKTIKRMEWIVALWQPSFLQILWNYGHGENNKVVF